MIIECINCNKKFSVESQLIPEDGRNIQCGSCNHLWFFDKNSINLDKLSTIDIKKETTVIEKKYTPIKEIKKTENFLNENINNTNFQKIRKTGDYVFSKILSYILVLIISFVALIIVLDTFKSPLYKVYPNLEFILFNFYETLKDINLFIQDLI